jgi:hypothetical protein
LLKLLAMIASVVLLFELLYRLGIYPVLTTSQTFDYKIMAAQRYPIGELKVLAAGSSAALYDISSRVMVEGVGPSYYNFGSWGMQITDMGIVLHALVEKYRPPYVVICSSVRDFMTPATASYAEYAAAPSFFRDHFPEYFYVRNYSPLHTLAFRRFQSRRPHFDPQGGAFVAEMWEGVALDRFADHLDFPTGSSELQYRALDSLCGWLRAQNVKLLFVQSPTRASYTNSPERRQALAAHIGRCRAIVDSGGGHFVNYHDTAIFADSLFVDLTHLSEAGGVLFTKKIVTDLKEIMR